MTRLPPIEYIARTRAYYVALRFGDPYAWAHHTDIPFAPLDKPLAETRLGLVTTAAPFVPEFGDQGPGAEYNGAAKFFEVYAESTAGEPDLRISHIAIDRNHTTAADQNSYFPLAAVREAVNDSRIGSIGPHFFGLPTDRDQQCTIDVYGNDILARCREDGIDAVLLFPNCPVCHQSVSLVARHLESHGIPTVVCGCAKDIVEYCGVPRFVFSDFPLGNAAGKPFDPASQAQVISLALERLVTATSPGQTVRNPEHWAATDAWKADYCNVEGLDAETSERLRSEFEKQQALGYAKKKSA
jgi:D-proline reductase (dithiol) PrdB